MGNTNFNSGDSDKKDPAVQEQDDKQKIAEVNDVSKKVNLALEMLMSAVPGLLSVSVIPTYRYIEQGPDHLPRIYTLHRSVLSGLEPGVPEIMAHQRNVAEGLTRMVMNNQMVAVDQLARIARREAERAERSTDPSEGAEAPQTSSQPICDDASGSDDVPD